MKKLKCIGSLMLLLLVGVVTNAGGQSRVASTVLGAGGGSSGNGTTGICVTVGQPVIGITTVSGNINHQGFWHPLVSPVRAGFDVREIPVTGERALTARIWPNPSSGSADLFVTVPAAGDFSAILYDMRGVAVRALHDGFCPAGRLNIPLDGTDLPSGAYTAVLTSGAERTMVVFHLAR